MNVPAMSTCPTPRQLSAAAATPGAPIEPTPDVLTRSEATPRMKACRLPEMPDPEARLDPARVAADQRQVAAGVAAGALPLCGMTGLLFADSFGKIKHMALQFGDTEFKRPLPEETRAALLGMYSQLFRNMAPDSRFTVVCANDRNEQSIRELVQETGIAPERVNIVNAQTREGMSIWIRDSMLPVRMPDGTTLLMIQDRTYWPGPEDNRVPALIDAADERISSSPNPTLRIDGGNILSNRHQIFVGHDSVEHTRARLQELAQDPDRAADLQHFYEAWTGTQVVPGEPAGPGQVTPAQMWDVLPVMLFEKAFQKDVLVIGADDPATPIKEEQPAFHIDMAVTPIGENKVLVGDPSMAIQTFQSLSPEERARVNAEMAAQAGLDPQSDLIGKLIEVNGTPEAQANYDSVARQLAGEGYEVERIPSMIGLRTTWSLPYLTYNNCMQDVYAGQDGQMVRTVFLPTYGCAPLDRMAVETYERNGFTVIPLEMAAISKLEGAIRCSTYAVERELPQGA